MEQRQDGYINVLNNFGTQRDSSNGFQYEAEGIVPDINLTMQYESDGLFARIINYPAEEALKHGYDFDGMDEATKKLANDMLDYIDWDENAITALKWSRLYGGSLVVMLIDDGGRLEEPLRYDTIRSIDELLVFERAIVTPDYTSMYRFGAEAELLKHRRSNFGMPEWYYVFSQFGSFKVHESRCLGFRNGRMPERTSQELYRFWGIPEFLRIRKKLQEADTSASYATKLLERAVQPVYGMKGLSDLLSTDSGEGDLLRRLQTIDLSRGLLNSMVIDSESESYEFKTAQLSGVLEVMDSAFCMLSGVTGIAQTVLLGRSPSGMNATGESDMDNTYAMVERLQRTQLRRPFEKLMDICMIAAKNRGKVAEVPEFSIKFNPLKTVSEMDQAQIDQTRATTQHIRAQTSQAYVDLGAVDPSEVRRRLGESGEYDVEAVLDDLPDEELLEIPGSGGEDGPGPEGRLQSAQITDEADGLCADGDGECRARNPSECPVHGNADKTKQSGSAAAKDHTLTGRSPKTQKIYDQAREAEQAITSDMADITGALGGELVGLEFSVKTASSVEDKIRRLTRKGMTEQQAIQSMGDMVRYTQLQSPEKISESVEKTVAKLKEKGYNITEVDNKYLDPSPGYKAIHIKAQSPNGQSFELQFHTPASIKAKNEAHELYERYRKLPEGSSKRSQLEAEANEKFAQLRPPPGIKGII